MINKTLDVSGGAVTWEVSRTSRAKLEVGLQSIGMGDLMPKDRTPKSILHEALLDLYANAKTLVRPLAKRSAFTVVVEIRGHHENNYTGALTAAVDPNGVVTVEPKSDEDTIQAAYRRMEHEMPGQSLTHLMVKAMNQMGGIPLRANGGVYWLPASQMARWEKLADCIERAAIVRDSSRVYLMQTGTDAKTFRLIRDRIIAETSTAVAALEEELKSAKLGERALQSRVQQADDLRKRLNEYSTVLGGGLDDIAAKLETVTQATATAMLIASAASGPVTVDR